MLRERAPELSRERAAARPRSSALIDDLIETRRAAGGAGLAATQVVGARAGRGRRGRRGDPRYPYKPLIPLTVIVNPMIEPLSRRAARDQRGLPVGAGICAATSPRHLDVRVRYLDRDGEPQEMVAAG